MEVSPRVAREIRACLLVGRCDLTIVSRALGSSMRSLQRALREEGTSFQTLVDRERREFALAHVGDVSVRSLAVQLGYADRRAFVRAFKRWTGTTPNLYRAGKDMDRPIGSSRAKSS